MNADIPARLARWIAGLRPGSGVPMVGINGAQGSGKSTLARVLQQRLAAEHGLRAAILSLDDLYLGRAERARLAQAVHPLLLTRGVPGTHDIALGLRLLAGLRGLAPGESLALPKFIKATDDRAPESAWPRVQGPVDVILFEGWCVGTPPQDEAELQLPVNALEAQEDAQGVWRRYVNGRLAGDYRGLFAQFDRLVFLQVPDFDSIFRWRLQQEAENLHEAGAASRPPDATALRRFIQHYERLTRHALRVLPARADVVLALGPAHEILRLSGGAVL